MPPSPPAGSRCRRDGDRLPVGLAFSYPDLNVSVAGETTTAGNHGPQMVVRWPDGAGHLVSNDVIHGFYVRDFNFSRYALPG